MRNRRKQVTREKIMCAAIDHFGRRGYEAASIHAIAEDAEVAHGTVFWHFTSKAALYVEVARTVATGFHDAMWPEIEREGGPPSLQALAARQFDLLEAHPQMRSMTLSLASDSAHPDLKPAMQQFSRRLGAIWRRWAQRAAERGWISAQIEPDVAGEMIALALTGAAVASAFGGQDSRARFNVLAQLLEAGCREPPSPSRP